MANTTRNFTSKLNQALDASPAGMVEFSLMMMSDHYNVGACLQFVKPSWKRKRIRARELKVFDTEQFKQDIGLPPLLSDSSSD